jgi:hypothetical protein
LPYDRRATVDKNATDKAPTVKPATVSSERLDACHLG